MFLRAGLSLNYSWLSDLPGKKEDNKSHFRHRDQIGCFCFLGLGAVVCFFFLQSAATLRFRGGRVEGRCAAS